MPKDSKCVECYGLTLHSAIREQRGFAPACFGISKKTEPSVHEGSKENALRKLVDFRYHCLGVSRVGPHGTPACGGIELVSATGTYVNSEPGPRRGARGDSAASDRPGAPSTSGRDFSAPRTAVPFSPSDSPPFLDRFTAFAGIYREILVSDLGRYASSVREGVPLQMAQAIVGNVPETLSTIGSLFSAAASEGIGRLRHLASDALDSSGRPGRSEEESGLQPQRRRTFGSGGSGAPAGMQGLGERGGHRGSPSSLESRSVETDRAQSGMHRESESRQGERQ